MSVETMVEVQRRASVLALSPVWSRLSPDEQIAFDARIALCDDWSQVAADDKALIRRGQFSVSAGESLQLRNPAEWGDWTAIDAAVDSGDLDELDEALATVGNHPDGAGPLATVDDEVDEDEEKTDSTSTFDPDDDGWVGA